MPSSDGLSRPVSAGVTAPARRRTRPAIVHTGLLLALLGTGCAARTPGPLATPSPVTAHARHLRDLQRDVATLVASPVLQRGLVAVHVESLDRRDTLFSYNADRLVLPASNMKILTVAAAAARLGWDYRFQTLLRATGPVVDGVLQGDLLVQGTGDPSINGRDGRADLVLAAWADAVAARGIQMIAGRVIGDGRAFSDADRLGAGWSWDDLAYAYASPVSGLQFDEDAVHLTITPGTHVDEPAVIRCTRDDTGLFVRNEVRTSAPGTRPSIALARMPGDAVLRVSGQVPLGGEPQRRSASIDTPAEAFARALASALAGRGILVTEPPARVRDVIPASPVDPPIAVDLSPPLRTLAVTLMKESQNLYAETLLRAMGRAGDAPATVAAGRQALMDVMQGWGVQGETIALADGSGLSRYNLVTARTLVHVLRHMYEDPVSRQPWLASLPVGGTDGTLQRRFKGSAAEGRVQAKTGTIAYVRALSGYVPSADGEQIVFSVIVNNATAPADAVTAVTDGIVDRLARFRR